jgi:cytochrome b
MANNEEQRDSTSKLIWDLPVRIFHWLLPMLILLSWYTVEVSGDMEIHMLSGYTILTLVLFRIAWGFLGPRYARFSSMLDSMRDVGGYFRKFFSAQPSRYAGHTPFGALSVVAMLISLAVQVSTGLFATDEDFYSGPLNEHVSARTGVAITGVHEANFNVLLALIVLHVAAIVYYLLFKRENLITPMFTGVKRDSAENAAPIKSSNVPLAVRLVLVFGLGVYVLVTWA